MLRPIKWSNCFNNTQGFIIIFKIRVLPVSTSSLPPPPLLLSLPPSSYVLLCLLVLSQIGNNWSRCLGSSLRVRLHVKICVWGGLSVITLCAFYKNLCWVETDWQPWLKCSLDRQVCVYKAGVELLRESPRGTWYHFAILTSTETLLLGPHTCSLTLTWATY